ncbi:MAG: hypothetical protein H7A51_14580 [Akkermansiaceae bacterium]|nr:hypothetical protein [Akkermansiaceae bacterium]
MATSQFPKEFKVTQDRLDKVPKEDLQELIENLWLRFNVEKVDDDVFEYNPEKEVGGGDLVEFVGELLEGIGI